MKNLILNRFFFIFFVFVLIVGGTYSFYSQTIPCDLTFKDGKVMTRTQLVGLHEDLLLVTDTGSNAGLPRYKIINVDKVTKMRFDNGNYFWSGMAIGGATGFITGIVLYELFSLKKKSLITKDATVGITFVFTLPAAIVGCLAGLAFRNVDNYDFTNMYPYEKIKTIAYIIRQHPKYK